MSDTSVMTLRIETVVITAPTKVTAKGGTTGTTGTTGKSGLTAVADTSAMRRMIVRSDMTAMTDTTPAIVENTDASLPLDPVLTTIAPIEVKAWSTIVTDPTGERPRRQPMHLGQSPDLLLP